MIFKKINNIMLFSKSNYKFEIRKRDYLLIVDSEGYWNFLYMSTRFNKLVFEYNAPSKKIYAGLTVDDLRVVI